VKGTVPFILLSRAAKQSAWTREVLEAAIADGRLVAQLDGGPTRRGNPRWLIRRDSLALLRKAL